MNVSFLNVIASDWMASVKGEAISKKQIALLHFTHHAGARKDVLNIILDLNEEEKNI